MSHCLYVAKGSGGLIKVGQTKNIQKRHIALKRDFAFQRQEIVRFGSTEMFSFCWQAEARLIRSANAQGLDVAFGREWFYGGDFDGLIQTAHKIVFEINEEDARERAELRQIMLEEAKRKEDSRRQRALKVLKSVYPLIQAGTLLDHYPELKEKS